MKGYEKRGKEKESEEKRQKNYNNNLWTGKENYTKEMRYEKKSGKEKKEKNKWT